jgi:hypothetical protein
VNSLRVVCTYSLAVSVPWAMLFVARFVSVFTFCIADSTVTTIGHCQLLGEFIWYAPSAIAGVHHGE